MLINFNICTNVPINLITTVYWLQGTTHSKEMILLDVSAKDYLSFIQLIVFFKKDESK